ncbi:AMP-binding protein [Kitasatospora aureofaciens]|uniref:AMP-binding protein n=1 Tax=Kitasatospora aureofaciens TaxID=1894 RepID=UPI00210BBDAC|nr:AMP-binding protein [Kitasatospora aureofaciens]
MQVLEDVLRRLGETDRPLVEVLDETTAAARVLSYRDVTRAAQALVEQLVEQMGDGGRPRKVGVLCGNTPEFVVADLALLAARIVEVPVPLAFSAEQAAGLLEDVDVCLVDELGERRLAEWGRANVLPGHCRTVAVSFDRLAGTDAGPLRIGAAADDWECKVIHTSGTTSRPKGVRIRAHAVNSLLESLLSVMPERAFARYLSVVPFSLLIEQVTGLYMVLLHEGTLVQLPAAMPLVGTDAKAVAAVMPFVRAARPTALVATPALVDEFAAAAEAADEGTAAREVFGTEAAPLICCGGAPVHPNVLRRLEALGLPVHEGYGLSENSSVVSWNTPGARRIGTVGRPLPHVRVRIADDGELLVNSTSLFAGYTRNDPSSLALDADGWLLTGDLARIDEDGYIHITGRKKNVIITGTGRNVAPEWVEAQYAQLPFVNAVAVVGDGLVALRGLFLVRPGTDPEAALAEITAYGREHLSEVERVADPVVLVSSEEVYRRFFTVTGRPVRAAVLQAIADGSIGSN